MNTKLGIIIGITMLAIIGLAAARHTSTTTINYCHYWDGHDHRKESNVIQNVYGCKL